MVTERLASESAPPTASVEQVREQFLNEELERTAETTETPPETADQPETQSEEEQPEQPEETPAVELPEGWEEHESVAELRRTAEAEGYNKAKGHLTRAHKATLADLELAHQSELENTAQRATANQVVSAFAEAINELDMTDPDNVKSVNRLLQSNASWAAVLIGAQERDAQARLANLATSSEQWTRDLPEESIDDFNATVQELAFKLRTQVSRADNREAVDKAYAAAINSYLEERDKLRDKVIIAREKQRLELEARRAAGLTAKADQRSNRTPPARPTGAAARGGRDEREVLVDPTTPIAEIEKIRKRQLSGAG